MTSRDFAFWCQGFFELRRAGGQGDAPISPEQAALIERHLALVFLHEIDPSMGPPAHQAKLNEVHAPTKPPTPHKSGHPLEGLGGPPGPDGLVMRC